MSPIIAQSVLEDIRLHNDIATVIGSYFNLHRSGSSFKALCPFHKEKTPSFMVNPQRQIYHCFGCGAGGDVFRFVMEYEKVDFMTAVKMLAQRAGIRLAFGERDGGDGVSKDILYEINDKVARLYHQCLLASVEGEQARAYLARRDLPASAVERFLIGFAPNRWDTVLEWAQKEYKREHLQAVGLILAAGATEGEGKSAAAEPTHWYDRFRNRLMFPIHDEQGRVVGFSGRIMEESDEKSAKYVNSPETALFHKGRILYALHHARRAIADAREAIICEGQIDVIRCHLAGFTTAVAAQGTAFTDDHARILKRYADSVALVFDGDRAGQDAALRAADTFLQVGLAVRIAVMPAGQDPDSLMRAPGGPAQFQQLIRNARSVIDFQVDILRAREAADTEAGLMRVAAAVLETIHRTPNAVQQARLIQQAAERLGVPEEALRKEWQRQEKRARPAAPAAADKGSVHHPSKEIALAEHLAAELSLTEWVKTYLPLNLIADVQCRLFIQACLDAAQGKRELMSLVAERDNEARDFSRFAAGVLSAPSKVKGDISTNEESVKSLILGIRTEALRRRRQEIEKQRQNSRSGTGPRLAPSDEKKLELDYCQLGYDLAKLKTWETAVPVMELL